MKPERGQVSGGAGFVAATRSYLVGNPDLATSQWMNFGVIVVVCWFATFLTMAGERSYGKAFQWLFMAGTVIPGLFIMMLAVFRLFQGTSRSCFQRLSQPIGQRVMARCAVRPVRIGAPRHGWPGRPPHRCPARSRGLAVHRISTDSAASIAAPIVPE